MRAAKEPRVIGTGWIGIVSCENTAQTAVKRAHMTCMRTE